MEEYDDNDKDEDSEKDKKDNDKDDFNEEIDEEDEAKQICDRCKFLIHPGHYSTYCSSQPNCL